MITNTNGLIPIELPPEVVNISIFQTKIYVPGQIVKV